MNALTNAVRDLRARSITFELPDADGTLVEIEPPTLAQVISCVLLDPKLNQSETEAAKVIRIMRQAKILFGPKNEHLCEQLQPLQVVEVIGALYIAASGLSPEAYHRWIIAERKAGIRRSSAELLQRIDGLIIALAAELRLTPAAVELMPLADAISLDERIAKLRKQKEDTLAIIHGVRFTRG